jgi:hypothetical protein
MLDGAELGNTNEKIKLTSLPHGALDAASRGGDAACGRHWEKA